MRSYLKIKGTTPYYNAIRKVAFPSLRTTVSFFLLMSTLGVGLGYLLAFRVVPLLIEGILTGLAVLFLPSVVIDFVTHNTIMRSDPLFYLRRSLALSLFSSAVWVLMFVLGPLLRLAFTSLTFPDDSFYVALFMVMPLRMTTVLAMSNTPLKSRFLFAVSQPFAVSVAALLFLGLPLPRTVFIFVTATAVALVFASVLLIHVEREGLRRIGFSPLRMFRAFLMDWLEGVQEPLEGYLERLAADATISASILGFRSKRSRKPKGFIVSSNFHPGPFLNVGSSPLPFLLQRLLEDRTGAPVLVSHGASGHELNLVSQKQNLKLVDSLFRLIEFRRFTNRATRFVRTNNGKGTASCQVFGGWALLTVTLAPDDMEDIPRNAGTALEREAGELFDGVSLVDAHNSLSKVTVMTPDKVGALVESARMAMKNAAAESKRAFQVGFGKAATDDFTLADGMGLGDVVAFTVDVGGQRSAYVSLDGNNMVEGLRGKALDSLAGLGFPNGEVMTTDTHMVNGVVAAKLGYNRIGEAVPWDRILSKINQAVSLAEADMEPVEVASAGAEVPVKVLGTDNLADIMGFIQRVARLTALTLFPLVILSAAVSLLLLV